MHDIGIRANPNFLWVGSMTRVPSPDPRIIMQISKFVLRQYLVGILHVFLRLFTKFSWNYFTFKLILSNLHTVPQPPL